MLLILKGKVVKVDLADCMLEAKRGRYGLFELTVYYDEGTNKHIEKHINKYMEEYIEVRCPNEPIEYSGKHIYLGSFLELMKSINSIINDAEFYIEQ